MLLASVNAFLVIAGGLLLVYRLNDATSDQLLWAEYRTNLGPIDKYFKLGGIDTFVGFMVFMVLIFAFHMVLGKRVYHLRRLFSVLIMAAGILLSFLAILVTNALLGL